MRNVHRAAIEVLGHRLEGAVLDTGRHLRREQLGADASKSESDRDGEEGEVHFRRHERTYVRKSIDREPRIYGGRMRSDSRASRLPPAPIQLARAMHA